MSSTSTMRGRIRVSSSGSLRHLSQLTWSTGTGLCRPFLSSAGYSTTIDASHRLPVKHERMAQTAKTAVPPHAGRSRAGVRHSRTDPRACGGSGGPGADSIPRVGSRASRDTQRAGACGGKASPGDTPITAHVPDSGRACGLHASGGDGTSPSGGSVRSAAGAAADRSREAWHGLRLDGPPMTAHALRRVAPFRGGQGVLSCAAFAAGRPVGYNAHHEGVCRVAQMRGCSGHNARDPPATNPVSLLRPRLFL